jgi:hypothetical protein
LFDGPLVPPIQYVEGGHRLAGTIEPRREFIQDNSLSANVDV